MLYATEKVKYNLTDDERKIDDEILEYISKLKILKKEYERIGRTHPKKDYGIKNKTDKMITLGNDIKYCISKINELQEKLYSRRVESI